MGGRKVRRFTLFILLAVSVAACQPDAELKQDRLAWARAATGEILVGVNWPFSRLQDRFGDGLLLAQEQINESGGILGRKLVLDIHDNEGDIDRAREIAKDFARNEKMVAVIGHAYSDFAIVTSIIYENAGLLLLSPRTHLTSLTAHDLDLFFRTSPSNAVIGQQAAEYTARLNYRRPIVVMDQYAYSKELAAIYQTNLAAWGIDVVYTFYYFPWNADDRAVTSEMQHLDHDLVFVSMDGEGVVDFVKDVRALGNASPIMAVSLPIEDLVAHAPDAAHDIFNVVYFSPALRTPQADAFRSAYEARFGAAPDNWAAKAFDTVNVLAQAIEKSGTTHCYEVAANLRYLKGWEGASGTYDFELNGDVRVEPSFLSVLDREGRASFRSGAQFQPPTLEDRLTQMLRRQIEDGTVEIALRGEVLSVALAESLLHDDDELASLQYDGRRTLKTIATAFASHRGHTLHVLADFDFDAVDLEDGIGSHTEQEVAEIRTQMVGSYLISSGSDPKRLFMLCGKCQEMKPESMLKGNRIEIVFVPDNLIEDVGR